MKKKRNRVPYTHELYQLKKSKEGYKIGKLIGVIKHKKVFKMQMLKYLLEGEGKKKPVAFRLPQWPKGFFYQILLFPTNRGNLKLCFVKVSTPEDDERSLTRLKVTEKQKKKPYKKNSINW